MDTCYIEITLEQHVFFIPRTTRTLGIIYRSTYLYFLDKIIYMTFSFLNLVTSVITILHWMYTFVSFERLTGREPLVFLPAPFSNEPPTGKAHLKQCEQMTLARRQKRLCRREPGLAETLRESVRLSLLECRYQFRNERWNCSLDGRGSLLKRGAIICHQFIEFHVFTHIEIWGKNFHLEGRIMGSK